MSRPDSGHRHRSEMTPGRPSCLRTFLAVALVLTGLAVEAWNISVRPPWAETHVRQARASDATFPDTHVNPYGVNTFLAGEVEQWKREKTMEMIASAGIGWIKQQFAWSEIEPARDSHWDEKYQQDAWKKYDDIVDLAERYGVRIIARLDHTPAWARPEGTTPNAPPSDPADYADFVATFVERYRGRVQYLQIWNEPNLAAEWGGTVDPDGYFELLRAAYVRAKAVDPNVVILSAPMAMTNERSGRAMPELDYWDRLYQLGAADYFDVMTASAYGLDKPPTDPPDPQIINVRRVELLRGLMERYGDANKAVWLNEYGWDAAPATFPKQDLIWGRVTEEEQARWTPEGIAWMRDHWPWAGVVSIWYFRHNGDIPPSAPVYYFRMVDPEFTPRDVYLTVKRDAERAQRALPGQYGEMEAPVNAYGAWPRVEDDRATEGQYIRSTQEGAAIELRFFGSGVDLLLPPGRPSGILYVEVDGRAYTADGIAKDSAGRSFVPLDRIGPDTRRITIVKDLESGYPQAEHRLRLTLGQNSSFGLDGVVVTYQRSYTEFGLFVIVGLASLGAGLGLMRWRP